MAPLFSFEPTVQPNFQNANQELIRTTIKFFYLRHGIEPTPTQGCPLPTVGHLHINVGNPASGGNNAICGGNGIRTFSIYGNSSFLQMFQGSRLMLCRLCLGVNLPIFSAHHSGKTKKKQVVAIAM